MTKLDIMDRGTSAVAALKNTVVPLRLGYVAVVNRSQADINSRRSMTDARRWGGAARAPAASACARAVSARACAASALARGSLHVGACARVRESLHGPDSPRPARRDAQAHHPPFPARAEAAWFDHHSEYSEVAASCGVGALARRINTLLGTHIRTTLPQLRRQIAGALEARAAELAGYGDELDLGSDSAK
jgi:hypothetical protein